MNCPECGKQVSNTAVACPSCGHPLAPQVLESQTVIREVAPPVIEKESFPKWILAPILILGAVLIFLFIVMFRNGEDENQRNINVAIKPGRDSSRTVESGSIDSDTTRVTTVPPSSADTTVVVPQNVPPSTQTNVTISENPDSTAAPTTSTVTLEAKITNKTGDILPVKAEKFYLLDKDLESILREADFEDKTGQGVVNAFGLAVLYPQRFPNVRETALGEINKHVVYDTLTDSSGKAQLKNVKPDSYYLFGITKTKTGFAVWSSPVTINPGANALNLTPARLTETQE